MDNQAKQEMRDEVYGNVCSQVLEFAYYAEMLETAGRKKEADSLREVANKMEQWLHNARS